MDRSKSCSARQITCQTVLTIVSVRQKKSLAFESGRKPDQVCDSSPKGPTQSFTVKL